MEDKETEKPFKVIFFRHCSRTSLTENISWSVRRNDLVSMVARQRLKCEGILMNKDIAFTNPMGLCLLQKRSYVWKQNQG